MSPTASFPLPPSLPLLTTFYHPSPSPPTHLLYFIPGNPGLISFYTHFLTLLSTSHPTLSILGSDHAGFSSPSDPHLYSLSDQVAIKLSLFTSFVSHEFSRFPNAAPPKVIVVGHSMGCWLTLEVLHSPGAPNVDLAVLLCPTVVDIAQSRTGRLVAPVITRGLGRGLASALAWVGSWVPELVAWGSGNRVEDVKGVLKPWVVKQAVWLGSEEMREIKEDRWGLGRVEEEETKEVGRRRLVWWFTENDGWVAEGVRECVEKWGERVVRDTEGCVHAFSLRHSEIVAKVVGGFIDEI